MPFPVYQMDVKPKNLNIYQVFKLKMNGCHMPSKTGGWVGGGGMRHWNMQDCRAQIGNDDNNVSFLAS